MRSSVRVLVAAVLLTALIAAPSFALEKQTRRFTASDHAESWRSASSCQITYYNYCTGWVWIWSGWTAGDRFGVTFTSCCAPGNDVTSVGSANVYFFSGSPPGYGFTGTMDLLDADANECPTGAALATSPFLPISGWNTYDFGNVVVPHSRFSIVLTMGPGDSNPAAVESDHPAAGPTGPAACGSCFPNTRTNHSYYWGTQATPICPGTSLNDGVCDAQLIFDVVVACDTSPVEPTTWGALKNLYR
jgi:hypothetical protein